MPSLCTISDYRCYHQFSEKLLPVAHHAVRVRFLYNWLVAVKQTGGNKLEVLAGGGGGADANEKTNVLLSSTRMENLGLAAGMSYARDWMGRVEWRADNLGTVKGFGKVVRMTPNDWCRVSDRDVAGYLCS